MARIDLRSRLLAALIVGGSACCALGNDGGATPDGLPPLPGAAADPAPAVGSDLARLQGEWVALAGPKQDIDVRLKVENREARFTVTLPGGQVIRAKSRISLDEGASPGRLDWTKVATLEGQPVPSVPGIYRVEGAGERWTICTGGPLGRRPAEFKAGELNPLATLLTFERPADAVAAIDERGPK